MDKCDSRYTGCIKEKLQCYLIALWRKLKIIKKYCIHGLIFVDRFITLTSSGQAGKNILNGSLGDTWGGTYILEVRFPYLFAISIRLFVFGWFPMTMGKLTLQLCLCVPVYLSVLKLYIHFSIIL